MTQWLQVRRDAWAILGSDYLRVTPKGVTICADGKSSAHVGLLDMPKAVALPAGLQAHQLESGLPSQKRAAKKTYNFTHQSAGSPNDFRNTF
jgi:hypothetical protein